MPLPNLSDKAVTGAIGKGAQNVAAGVIAAAKLPFAYGGMLLRNQLNSSLAQINPMNYLQGITNILTPASGEFTRLYNKAGGGRQAAGMSPIGGAGGSIDITPLVESIDGLAQLTDQRLNAILIENKKVPPLLLEHKGLIEGQTKLLTAMSGGNNAPKQVTDDTKTILLLEDLRDKSEATRVQAVNIHNSILGIRDDTRPMLRYTRNTMGWTHQLLEAVQSGKGLSSNIDPFGNINDAREDAERIGDGSDKPVAVRDDKDKKNGMFGQILALIGTGVMGWLSRIGGGVASVFGVVGRLLAWLGGGALVTMFVRGFTGLFNGLGSALGAIGRFLGLAPRAAAGGANAAAGAASGAARTAAARGAGQTVARGALSAAGRRALGLIPVVGSAIYGMDAYNDFREGNIVGGVMNTAAAGVNLIPGAGWIAGLGLNMAANSLTDANTDERLMQQFGAQPQQPQPRPALETPRRNESTSKLMRMNERQAAVGTQNKTGNAAPVTVVNNYNTTNNNGNGQGRVSVNTGKSLADRSKDEWFRYVN